MNLVNDAFECYSVNRFTPSENEDELQDMALQFKENETFYAGIAFLDEITDHGGENNGGTVREHTKYKIRLAMDETPRTHELKPKYD